MTPNLTARVVAFSLACLAATAASADEGMWMPAQLPQIADRLAQAGYTGDASALADLTTAPLDAVVRAGGGTGAFVSAEGLVLTNHHVAYGVIQYNSSPQRDLIRDGFIAADRAAELPANPDFRVLVTVGFDPVTDQVLGQARGKRGRAYFDAVDAASKAIVAECERQAGIRCSVANMYNGSDFYRIRQLELRDLRLVYAPPRAEVVVAASIACSSRARSRTASLRSSPSSSPAARLRLFFSDCTWEA